MHFIKMVVDTHKVQKKFFLKERKKSDLGTDISDIVKKNLTIESEELHEPPAFDCLQRAIEED